jgi:hypothetical protein
MQPSASLARALPAESRRKLTGGLSFSLCNLRIDCTPPGAPPMPRPPTRLADNRVPTEGEWTEAVRLGRQIIRAVDDRDAIIADRDLDRRFVLGGSSWASDYPQQYLDAYRLLRTLDWNEVRQLRLRCQIFSGFNLLENQAVVPGMDVTAPVPEDPHLAPDAPESFLRHWGLLTDHLPTERVLRPPCALGEIGWQVDDGIVNLEIIAYQERITLLHYSGVLDHLKNLGHPPRILEIGAGYGPLALALTSCFPDSQYTICDLPESLLFSGLYLTLAGQRRVALLDNPTREFTAGTVEIIPNYFFGDLVGSGRTYDLAINVLSMSEMSDYQIEGYGRGLSAILGRDGLFFEQNQDNRHVGLTYTFDTLAQLFPYHLDIDPQSIPLMLGKPRLWANLPVNVLGLEMPKPEPPPELPRLIETVGGLNEAKTDVAARLSALEGQLSERTALAQDGLDRIKALESTAQDGIDRIKSLESTINERTNRLDSLERTLDERSYRLVAVEHTLEERSNRIMSLEAAVEALHAGQRGRFWRRLGSFVRRRIQKN